MMVHSSIMHLVSDLGSSLCFATYCVTLGKLLELFKPHFPNSKQGEQHGVNKADVSIKL